MGQLPRAFLILCAAAAFGQDDPDGVVCTEDGAYELCTPAAVTDTGLPDRSGHGGNVLTVRADESGVGWTPKGGDATPLSDTAAVATAATAAPGSATEASRQDHVHPQTGLATTAELAAVANTVNRPTGSALADGQVNTLDNCTGSGSSRHCTTEWQTPASGFPGYASIVRSVGKENSPGTDTKVARGDHVHAGGSGGGGTPLPDFDGAGKVLATNAADDGAEWVTPAPDVSNEVAIAEDAIDALEVLTQDLHAPPAASGWTDATAVSAGGVAVLDATATLTTARAATYAVSVADGSGKRAVVRLPAATASSQARLKLVDDTGDQTYFENVNGFTRLGNSTDGTFTYYADTEVYGSAVRAVTVQLSGSAAHVGQSTYAGTPTKVQPWAIIGNSTAIPVRQVPDPTHIADGHVVTAAGGSYGWAAPSGGGGGASDWTLLASHTQASRTSAEINPDWTYADGHTAASCWTGLTAATPWQAVRLTIRGDSTEFIQVFFSTGNLDLDADNAERFQLFAPVYFQIDMGSGSGQRIGYASLTCSGPPSVSMGMVVGEFRSDQMAGFPWKMELHYLASYAGGGGGTATPLSDGAPLALGTAAAGVGTAASRGDHVHPTTGLLTTARLPTANDEPKPLGVNAVVGSGPALAAADHVHPLAGPDVVTWSAALVSTLTGGGASGGVTCDGAGGNPSTSDCRALRNAVLAGTYKYVAVRVARADNNNNDEPYHVSGCAVYPGVPGSALSGTITWQTACTANSGKNSADTFTQYDVFVSFGSTGNFIQVRLPNYNSHGVSTVAVSLIGVR